MIFFVKQVGWMSVNKYDSDRIRHIEFDKRYFCRIADYNRLMLSVEFYNGFFRV